MTVAAGKTASSFFAIVVACKSEVFAADCVQSLRFAAANTDKIAVAKHAVYSYAGDGNNAAAAAVIGSPTVAELLWFRKSDAQSVHRAEALCCSISALNSRTVKDTGPSAPTGDTATILGDSAKLVC